MQTPMRNDRACDPVAGESDFPRRLLAARQSPWPRLVGRLVAL